MNTLISIAQLASLREQNNILIFDCRFSLQDPEAGHKAWESAHIPGARHVDMNLHLSAPHVPGVTGRHPLPPKTEWLDRMQAWGISPEMQVVMYDDAGGAGAARMWWMLQWAGHSRAAVLNGGWQGWIAVQMPVTTDIPVGLMPTVFHYGREAALATLISAANIDGEQQLLLDAREPARFRGELEPLDPVAGHIPGALCSPFSGNLTTAGTFKNADELRRKFAPAVATEKPVVCYCGSGITACHNILALTIAGLPMPALYAGSWSEWITDPQRPVETGD